MTLDPAAITAGILEPIDLVELNSRAALQTRVDAKYVIGIPLYGRLLERLRGSHDVLHVDGRCSQDYDTYYFDTVDLQNYRAHLQRRRRSFKIRTRTYLSSAHTVFEVKMTDGRGSTVKRRIDHDDRPDRLSDTGFVFTRQMLRAHYGFELTGSPTAYPPVLRNRYSRITLAANAAQERVTIDFDLHFARTDTHEIQAAMSRDAVLIETKTADGAGAVDRQLWELGARPKRVSKYCIGLGMTVADEAPNRYVRTCREFFGLPALLTPTVATGPPAVGADAPPAGAPRAPRAPRPPRAVRGLRPLRTADTLD